MSIQLKNKVKYDINIPKSVLFIPFITYLNHKFSIHIKCTILINITTPKQIKKSEESENAYEVPRFFAFAQNDTRVSMSLIKIT